MQSKVGKKWTILSELIEKFGSPFKEFSISHYVFGPKLPHYSLHVVGVKTTTISRLVAKLTQADSSSVGFVKARRKCRIDRFMDDTVRRNIELVAPD